MIVIKRERTEDDDDAIKQHYNDLKKSRVGRTDLVKFNNAVKSMLLDVFARKKSVLDLCGGKGGDLEKWRKCHVSKCTLVDVADQSVAEAKRRYQEMKWSIPAQFIVADCHQPLLLPPSPKPYQVVTCQFALHYAFETESKARALLRNAASALGEHGHFIITVPDPEQFKQQRFENSICSYDFQDAKPVDNYGSRYLFHLDGCVLDAYEYRVPTALLISLAKELKLRLVSQHNFTTWRHRWAQEPLWKQLVGNCSMTKDEEAVFGLYQAIVFQKKS